MNNRISVDKIGIFREFVNDNQDFILNQYQDINGKNHWNLLCSCMDWLTVAATYLQNPPRLDSNLNIQAMQMFTLISSIDLIYESINQLHRIFCTESKLPFKGEKVFFTERLFDEDDNSYFKSIRASFGAHPVNLNNSNVKRFASWPSTSFRSEEGLTVQLYSSTTEEEDLLMNLYWDELISFAIQRYEYLDVITKQIVTLYEKYKNELRNTNIEKKFTPLEQLYILQNESLKRENNDYYKDTINKLIIIFKTELSDTHLRSLAQEYKISLLPLINEIMNNLQKMEIVDLEYDCLFNQQSNLKKTLSYELGKFHTWFYGNRYDPLIEYYLRRFNEETNFKFNFNTEDSESTLFLKVKLMLLA